MEAEGEYGTGANKLDDSILTQLTEELNSLCTENSVGHSADSGSEGEGEPNLVGNECLKETAVFGQCQSLERRKFMGPKRSKSASSPKEPSQGRLRDQDGPGNV